jgi:3-oxoacyl-[acyl-carrier protein] reductase
VTLERTDRPVAVVSGGGSGVGRATTRALADGGAEVLILGPSNDVLEATAREIEAEIVGSSIAWLEADLADPDDAQRVVEHVGGAYGVLDAVVACAAGEEADGPAPDLKQMAGSWRAAFDRDVLGAVLFVYGVAPLLRRPGGRVVLVRPAAFGATRAVAATGGALSGWVGSLAAEFGPEGIAANVVVPAYPEPPGDPQGGDEPERIARALGATGRSDDVAGVIRFLVSPDGASVTGQVIEVVGTAPRPVV